jgi:hypothetical protein
MAANYSVTTGVGTTPTLIAPANSGRNFLIVQNVGSTIAYFGWDTNITSSSYAFSLTPQATMNLGGPQTYSGPIYAVTASSTTSISYGDVGQ